MQRYGMVINVDPEKINKYKELHTAVWPDVLKKITECNILNYSIYLKDCTLFSYFEYVGIDFNNDMKKMAADPATQKWWIWLYKRIARERFRSQLDQAT